MTSTSMYVDYNALRINQFCVIILNVIAFILQIPFLTLLVAIILITGVIVPRLALFQLFYRFIIIPLKIIKQNFIEESPSPHKFAQFFGGIFLAIGSVFLYLDNITIGWILVWLVICLATINLVFGFCLGCFIYFQFSKFGIKGFN